MVKIKGRIDRIRKIDKGYYVLFVLVLDQETQGLLVLPECFSNIFMKNMEVGGVERFEGTILIVECNEHGIRLSGDYAVMSGIVKTKILPLSPKEADECMFIPVEFDDMASLFME